jgi:hypothetical protein
MYSTNGVATGRIVDEDVVLAYEVDQVPRNYRVGRPWPWPPNWPELNSFPFRSVALSRDGSQPNGRDQRGDVRPSGPAKPTFEKRPQISAMSAAEIQGYADRNQRLSQLFQELRELPL